MSTFDVLSQMQSQSQSQRFGALDMVKRHWDHRPVETKSFNIADVTSPYFSPGSLSPAVAAPPQPSYIGNSPGSPSRYSLPVSGGFSSANRSSNSQRERIVMPGLLDDGRLGLAMKNLQVVNILNNQATTYGWVVGDQIISVNDIAVYSQEEFSAVLKRCVDEYTVRRTPLVFDIYRSVTSAWDTSAQPRDAYRRQLHDDPCCGPPPAKEVFDNNYFVDNGMSPMSGGSPYPSQRPDYGFPGGAIGPGGPGGAGGGLMAEEGRRRREACAC